MLLAPVGVGLARWMPNAPFTVAFSLVLAWVMVHAQLGPACQQARVGQYSPYDMRVEPGRRPPI